MGRVLIFERNIAIFRVLIKIVPFWLKIGSQ